MPSLGLIQSCADVEIHHLETAHQLEFNNVSVVAQGPLRAAVKAEIRYGQSLITATVSGGNSRKLQSLKAKMV